LLLVVIAIGCALHLEHCPMQHFINGQDLLDTLGEIRGTNAVGLANLTQCARRDDSYTLRAAALVRSGSSCPTMRTRTASAFCRPYSAKRPSHYTKR
jgi:hypothetical protein